MVLLHAPSVYDFRKIPALHGPISDVIPSTPVFEMYPLGFISMVGYLEQHGYRVRIINLAVKMLRKPDLDVEGLLSKIDAQAFGLDLHWLAHAAGSLDIANMVKKLHPDKPVILGGFSSSYYHEELIQYFPQVDYVLRGDTVEKPLLDLMGCIEGEKEPDLVENLTWRSDTGRKRINPLTSVPTDWDESHIDYGEIVKLVVRHRDLESVLPYESFMEYPFTALFTCKGCNYNCVTCGGSSYAFKNFLNRERPIFKTPERLVEEMNIISEYFKAPLFLIGDLRQGGRNWAEAVLSLIKKENFDNTITYELFDSAPEEHIKKLAKSADSWTIEISPESHEDTVRKAMGKPYTTQEMEDTIAKALEYDASKIDVYFMVGLPKQTKNSVLKTIEYSQNLYEKMGESEKIHTFIAPMAPFLDPGSVIFENPRKYGFNQLYKTLREHKKALYQPTWKRYLSYYTDWMTPDDITYTTYEAMIRMNKLKGKMGVIDQKRAEKIDYGLRTARDIIRQIDKNIPSTIDEAARDEYYKSLQLEIDEIEKSMVSQKRELRMPGLSGFRIVGALKYLIKWIGSSR
jgi:B12-binding domain/radical SAM domain protein